MRAHSRPLLGLVYLIVVALLVTLSVQIYRKATPWQRVVEVSLRTRVPGLELNPHSDVKFQGVLVGEVREVTTDGRFATIHLAIDPDHVKLIPGDVDAAIVPKTLFGEKYVDLRARAGSEQVARIADGDAIKQSTTSVELGLIFDRLVPILQTLRPDQLSTVLTNLADALDGRGEAIAATLRNTDEFLQRLDPSLATLVHDVEALGDTADIYADAAPDLLTVLGNAARISQEQLVPDERKLAAFLDTITGTADTTSSVLRRNGADLITLTGRARPVLELLDYYAPELPCILKTLRVGDELLNRATAARGSMIGLTLELLATQAPYENPKDLPGRADNDTHPNNLPSMVPNWKPHCPQLPKRVLGLGPTKPYSLDPYSSAVGAKPSAATPQASAPEVSRGRLASALAAHSMGQPAAITPGFAGMLMEPMLTDGQVVVQ